MVRALGPRTTGRGYRLVDVAEGKTVLPVTTSGAYTLDVAGLNGAIITTDGDLGPLDFTGWDAAVAGVFSRQTVRVDIVQDATGGHAFDWAATEGVWAEELGALSTIPGDTVVSFDVVTLDGGTSISLEPVGIQYQSGCVWADAAEVAVPDVTAGGDAIIGHNLSIVTSVDLVRLSDGKNVRAEWFRTDPLNPAAPVRIVFTDAAPAGTWVALVSGKGSAACELTATTSEWYSLVFQADTAATLTAQVDWAGNPDDVQWVWGDGTFDNPGQGVNFTHTYNAGTYPGGYTGDVVLRWRKGTQVTKIDTRFDSDWSLNAAASDLPRDLLELILTSTPSNISGVTANLPPNIQRVLLNNTNSTLAGTTGDIPRSLTYLNASNTPSEIVGPAADLPTAMTYLGLGLTSSNLTGAFADLPATLLTVTLNDTNSTITGATGDLPAGLVDFRMNDSQAALTGPVSALPSTLQDFYLTMTNSAVTGLVSEFPAGLLEISIGNTLSVITGDMSTAPAGLTVFSLVETPSAVTWNTSFTPAIASTLSLEYAAGGTALTPTQVDQALIDLAAAGVTPILSRLIGLGGPINAARTTASDAAVTTLTGAGWTVSTN